MLYDVIRNICSEKGLSIRYVERKAQLTNGTIGKWNECEPSANNLFRVAKVLGYTVEELLELSKTIQQGKRHEG